MAFQNERKKEWGVKKEGKKGERERGRGRKERRKGGVSFQEVEKHKCRKSELANCERVWQSCQPA